MAKDVLIVPASGQIQLSGSSDPAGTIQSSGTTIQYDSARHDFTGSFNVTGSLSVDGSDGGTSTFQGAGSQVTLNLTPDGSNNNYIVSNANEFSFRPGGTTVMNIESSGEVGIGTTNPAYTLDVSGNARFTSEIRLEDGLAAPAVGDDLHLGNGLSTTPKIRLGTSSWANNYGLESYWSVFSTNSNEGYRFKDSGGNELLRIQGNTSSGGAGTRSFNVLGVLVPMTDSSVSIGTSSLRWTNIYTDAANIAGNITVTGTVDGRDVASDGSKLDGIESGATADQSAAEILTAIKTVDGAASGLDADLLDGVQATGYVNTTSTQTIAGTKTFSTQISGDISGYSGNLIRTDNRTISPSEYTTGRLNFGFTSWGNNNSSPWADFIHLRGYTDSSGGKDHLLMFKKTGGSTNSMRIWSQDFGSSTAYSSYADVVTTDNNSTNVTVPTLTITGLSNQSSENTVVTINGSNVLGTRELGSNAFNSTGYLETTGGTISGNLTVTGTVTAEEFHTEFVSSSILFKSGSTKSGNSFDDLHNFTGSVFMDSSGSGDNNVFVIDGEQGRLFSVVDEISGSLFSANTVAGLPVIEAFSDNTVTLGPYSSPINITSTGNISGSATSTGSFGQIRSGVKILANTTNDARSHVIIANGNIGGPTYSGTYVSYVGGNNENFANNDFRFYSAETTKNLLYLDAGNNTAYFQTNVGIGISSTTKQLHLKNTSGDIRGILVETTVATSYAELQLKAAKEFRIGTGGSSTTPANQFYIYDAGAGQHRLDIDTNGNVGIGDISPSYKLDVNGTGRFTGVLRLDSTLTFNGSQTIETIGGSDSLYINPNANLYLGTAATDHTFIGASSRNVTVNATTFTVGGGITLSGLSSQNSEATALVINGSNVVGTRELGSNAFNSTSYLGATSNAVSATALSDAGGITTDPGAGKMIHNSLVTAATTGIFSTSNNANSIITINKHTGNYFTQLGFNSGHDMFIRGFNNRSLSTGQSDTWYKVWTEANDGASSGLDADLLDGQHGSYYKNLNNMDAGTLSVGRGGTGANSFTSNAVLTGNASDAIQAESGLIYNGSGLAISGEMDATVNTNTGHVNRFTNNNTGTSAYTEVIIETGTSGRELRLGSSHNYSSAQWNNTWVYAVGRDLKLATDSGYDIDFYAGGTNTSDIKMSILSGGNVGIGTTSPESLLHIEGTTNATMRIHNTTSGNAPQILFEGKVGANADYLLGKIDATWDGASNVVSSIRFESGTDTSNKDDGMITFWTSPASSTVAERFRIDQTGNVIIRGNDKHLYGLTSGNATIQLIGVRGDNYVEIGHSGYGIVTGTGNWALDGSDNMTVNANAYFAELLYHSGDTDTYIHFLDDRLILFAGGDNILDYEEDASSTLKLAGGGEADVTIGDATTFFIGGSQGSYDHRVGIGTSSPSQRLTVQGSSVGQAKFHSTGTSGARIYISDGSAESAIMGGSSTLIFEPVSGNEKMRITSEGNVGIGNTSPNTGNGRQWLSVESGSQHGFNYITYGNEGHLGNTSVSRLRVTNNAIGYGDGAQTGIGLSPYFNKDYASMDFYWDTSTGTTGGYLAFKTTKDGGSSLNTHMTITPSGSIGIGTTSPSYKLHVAGTAFATNLTLSGWSSGDALKLNYGNASGTVEAVSFLANGGTNGNIKMVMSSANVGDLILNGANNTDQLTLYRDGNVGIGITTPQTQLEVDGTGFVAHFGKLDNTNAQIKGFSFGYRENNSYYRKAAIVQETIGDSAARGHVHFLVDTVNDQNSANINDAKMTIHGTSGNIGIGTRNPGCELDIQATAGPQLRLKNTNQTNASELILDGYRTSDLDVGNIMFHNNGDNIAYISAERSSANNSGKIVLGVRSAGTANNAVNILPSGNVGIGVTDPDQKLEVAGTIKSTNELGLQVLSSGASARIELESNSHWSYTRLKYNGSVIWDIASYQGGDLQFRPAGSGTNAILMTSAGIMNIQQLTSAGSGKSSFAGEVEINSNDGLDVNAGAATALVSHAGGGQLLYSGYGFSTATSQTIVSNATAVNLSIGGSTKLGLTAATTTVSNALSVPSGNTSLGGKLNVASSVGIGSFGLEKTFSVSFSNGVSNQKFQIQFTKFWGELEISVSATFGYQNAAGVITKKIGAGLQNGSLYAHEARYTEVLGVTADNFAIGDITWDSTNSRYYVPIVHRTSTGNSCTVRVRCLGGDSSQTDFIENLVVGSVYTTDTTTYDKPKVSFVDGDGLDIQAPLKVLGSSYNHLELESAAGNVGIVFDVETSNTNYYDWRIDAQGLVANGLCFGVSTGLGNNTFDANGTVMTLKSDGKVGIGTTSPAGDLHISNNSPMIIFDDEDVSNLRHRIAGGGNVGLEYASDMNNVGAGYHRWEIGGSVAMKLIEGGSLRIGDNTNPAHKLDVQGRVRAYGNNTGFITGTSSAGISANGQSFYIGDIDDDDAVSALYVKIMADTMLTIDEDDASFSTNIKLTDNHKLRLGTGTDFDIYHSGTHSYIDNNTGGLYITSPTTYFGSSATGGNDIYIYGDTSGRYIQWDASAERLKLFDNVILGFGTGNAEEDDDGRIYSDGTNVIATADGLWRFTSNVALNATGKLYFDAGSNTYIHEHSADTINVVTGGSTRLTINSSGITVNGTVSGNLAGAAGMRGYFFFGDPNTHYSNQSSIDKTHYLDMAQGHQANASYHGVVMPRAGSITAVSINYDTILATASQYSGQYTQSTLRVYKNSSNVWNAKTLTTSGVAQGRDAYATVADGTYTFSAGDVLKLVIFSDDVSVGGAYSRVGFDDITAYIEVTFDN